MIKGIFTASAGLREKLLVLDALSNNLANINTTGFKGDGIFARLLNEVGIPQSSDTTDTAGLQVKRFTDHTEGEMIQTNDPWNVAIQGRGFFVVATPQGQRYTRDGRFLLANDGSLTTTEGYQVFGRNGPIRIPDLDRETAANVVFTPQGDIVLQQHQVAQLQIVDADDVRALRKDERGFFISDTPLRTIDPAEHSVTLRQGYLEGSNVDGIEAMIALIETSRDFESLQKALQTQDAALARIMDVGRVL